MHGNVFTIVLFSFVVEVILTFITWKTWKVVNKYVEKRKKIKYSQYKKVYIKIFIKIDLNVFT